MVPKQADEGIDILIAGTALNLACTNNYVILVSKDDLLVTSAGLCTQGNVYFLKPGRGKVPQQNVFSS